MRILYVTGMWSGLESYLKNGKPTGMPAFIKPLLFMAQSEYIEVIIYDVKYLHDTIIYRDNIKFTIISTSMIGIFRHILSNLSVYKTFDIVYGHGSIGSLGYLIAKILNIKYCQRIYGTFLYKEITTNSLWKIFARHPLEYLAFKLPSALCIVTNDGTFGNIVFEKIGGKSRRMEFLMNGVDKHFEPTEESGPICRFIHYPARIDRWKRLDYAVDFISELHKLGNIDIKLVVCGKIIDQSYFDEVKHNIEKLGLTQSIIYMGEVDQSTIVKYNKNCLAFGSFYDVSNLGNALLEAVSQGCTIVSRKDTSVGFIEDNGMGILANTPQELAEKFNDLLKKEELPKTKNASKVYSRDHLMTWLQRCDVEHMLLRSLSPVKTKK